MLFPIMKIFFNNGIDLSTIDTTIHQMMAFTDTAIRRSMNAQQDRQEQQGQREKAEEVASAIEEHDRGGAITYATQLS